VAGFEYGLGQVTSLLEFIIASALSVILLSGVSSTVIYLLKSYYELRTQQDLFFEAELITQIFKQNLFSQNQWGCQNISTSIENYSQQVSGDFNQAIKIYSADNMSAELPLNIRKKLLSHSHVIQQNNIEKPMYIALDQPESSSYQLIGEQQQLEKQNVVLLFNCQHAWLFDLQELWHRQNQTWIKLPSEIKLPLHTNFLLAKWQITWWFVMKNNQGDYGLYRLILPYERAPVELIDHVKMMQTKVVGNKVEIHLDLAEAKQKLHWTIVV